MQHKWKKFGKIFESNSQFDWMKSHSTTPLPYQLDKNIYRIYFSTRDKYNRNQLASLEIDINHPHKYFNLSSRPHFNFGEEGHFDCDGVYGTSLVKYKNKLFLYYAGWNAGVRGLFFSSIGVSVSSDNGKTFERIRKSPILFRDEIDPWSVMAPFVLIENNVWKMWYASGIKISSNKGKINSLYDIKYAQSHDGILWEKNGKSSISLGQKDSNIARPCILVSKKGVYKAWYPYVSKQTKLYSIGYGESTDGISFTRKDNAQECNIKPSAKVGDWDSNSVTYPYVFKHKNEYYILYNGNDFGKTGFGLAKWQRC